MASNKFDAARQGLKRARELASIAKDFAVSAATDALRRDPAQTSGSELQASSKAHKDLEAQAPEPPVVARLMVEIRSDGSRTIARGALQDELTGEQVAIEAKGNSPIELAGQLAKSLLTAPLGLGLATIGRALPSKKRNVSND